MISTNCEHFSTIFYPPTYCLYKLYKIAHIFNLWIYFFYVYFSSWSAVNSIWNWILWYRMRRISNICWSYWIIVRPICRWVLTSPPHSYFSQKHTFTIESNRQIPDFRHIYRTYILAAVCWWLFNRI